MKSNILAFTKPLAAHTAKATAVARDNVVSISAWQKLARPYRTPQGVHFISNVLCTPGDAA